MDLDRVVAGRLRLEHCLYLGLLAAALVLRLFLLGYRPLHHDESIHSYYAWRILTQGLSDYRYDPVYHGPTLYYLTALFHALLGASDFSARALPVVSSLGLVALAWPLRPLIGRREALAYAALVTFSPTLGYYGRSLRHDVPMVFFTFAAAVAFLHYLRDRRRSFLYLAAASIGLASATKEDIYLTGFTFANALWIVGVWPRAGDAGIRRRAVGWAWEVWAFLGREWARIATATLVVASIYVVFYTSLLTHPENWNATARALRYWWGQHTIQRIGGPWWYYVPLEVVYEPLIFFGALLTFGRWLWRSPAGRIEAFFGAWAAVSFALYAWAQEKVPWLLVPFLVPQAVLAASFFARQSLARLVPWTPLALLTLWALLASSFLYDAPRTTEPPAASHSEPMVYVQSTYDVPQVLAEVRDATRKLGTGRRTPMVVVGEATWPLSWYLRRYPVHWGSLPRETDAPILIMDPKDADRLEKDLAERYTRRRFAVRGWWQIDWNLVSPANVLQFLLHRRTWNPPGTTDAVMFLARDLSPRRAAAKLRLTPAPPLKNYVGTPPAAKPVRAFGGPGTAPGRFQEPRGLAMDRDGHLLVADSKNNRVQKLDRDGQVLGVWGGPAAGDAPGRFNALGGVAAAPDGSVFVADTWNHRVQKLDADGRFVLEWRADDPGFWGPRAVAIGPDGSVFVADTGNKRVLVYDGSGERLRVIGGEGSEQGRFVEPVGLAIDPERNFLYVADTGNHRVQVFDPEGRYRSHWTAYGWQEFYTEPYLAWHAGALWATDSFNHRVNAYDATGRLRHSIGGAGSGLNRPIGVAVSSEGELFVADTLNHRIVVYRIADLPSARNDPAKP